MCARRGRGEVHVAWRHRQPSLGASAIGSPRMDGSVYSRSMRLVFARFAGFVACCLVLSCGGSDDSPSHPGKPNPTGTVFHEPFVARDTLLVHPQSWKSASRGSTAILMSSTPDLCAQITS